MAKKQARPKKTARRKAARPAKRAATRVKTRPKTSAAAAKTSTPRPRRTRGLARAKKPKTFTPGADARMLSAARAGHDDMKAQMAQHTEASPALTAGDVDAKWQDAYAIGDEAPGGDNPTPDQNRVDEIGKALGVEYQDAQELQGGEEVTERDHHRWELDPASAEDWPRDKKKK